MSPFLLTHIKKTWIMNFSTWTLAELSRRVRSAVLPNFKVSTHLRQLHYVSMRLKAKMTFICELLWDKKCNFLLFRDLFFFLSMEKDDKMAVNTELGSWLAKGRRCWTMISEGGVISVFNPLPELASCSGSRPLLVFHFSFRWSGLRR